MIVSALFTILAGLAAYYGGLMPSNPYDSFVAGVIVMMFFGLWLKG